MELNSMTVHELRTECRTRKCDVTGSWIASANRESLLNVLNGAPVNAVSDNGSNGHSNLAALIASAISSHLPQQTQAIDESKVNELIDAKLASNVKTIEIKRIDGSVENIGKQHEQFADLLLCLSAECHVLLSGCAGSGKTSAAESCAKALGLDYYPFSCGPMTSQSQMLGFMHANGGYVYSPCIRPAFEKGGLLLLDEIDASNPGVMTCLNALLSNGYCAFPDGVVKKHPKFVCVAAANTLCDGATSAYVGRNPIDGATRDRFVIMHWGIDEKLENEIVGNLEVTSKVQAIRHKAESLGIQIIISPRASIFTAKLIKAGASLEQALNFAIYNKLDKENCKRLKGE